MAKKTQAEKDLEAMRKQNRKDVKRTGEAPGIIATAAKAKEVEKARKRT